MLDEILVEYDRYLADIHRALGARRSKGRIPTAVSLYGCTACWPAPGSVQRTLPCQAAAISGATAVWVGLVVYRRR